MTQIVNTIWVDPESQKNLALLNQNGAVQNGAFVQTQEDQPAGGMEGQKQANNDNLAAFEGLKGKAEEALQRIRDEETKKQSEHDVNMMSVKQAIALAENNVDDAKKERARLSEEMAKAKDELGEVEASKAADEKSLEETQHECQASAVEWENRQKEGSAEMAAIQKAKQILADGVTVLIQVKSSLRTDNYASA